MTGKSVINTGHSALEFIGSIEVKLLVWKTVKKDLNNLVFFVLAGRAWNGTAVDPTRNPPSQVFIG